jgi:hypothetical protein
VYLNPNSAKSWDIATLRPGPIISKTTGRFDEPKDALLYGHVYFAEDGRTVVRYTEIQLEGGARVPICFTVVTRATGAIDLSNVHSRTEESVRASTIQVANRFRVLPD